jgi:alpha-amylase/alpha-mannosidase (GH57 family)
MCFKIHQPNRIRNYTVFDINNFHDYFIEQREIIEVISKNCYIPAINLMLRLIENNKDKFKFGLVISGSAIELFQKFEPKIIDLFKKLIKTGNVELISTTYFNSLSCLYSKKEFKKQVNMNNEIIKKTFGIKPNIFANTLNIYDSKIKSILIEEGFKYIIADNLEKNNDEQTIFKNQELTVIEINNHLSELINKDFSNQESKEYPITAEKYFNQINNVNENINLSFNFENFGETHRVSSGIFKFFEALTNEVIKENEFLLLSELNEQNLKNYEKIEYNMNLNLINNKMQKDMFNELTILPYEEIHEMENYNFYHNVGKIQDIINFQNVSTENFKNNSPYEVYIYFKNILKDVNSLLDKNKLKEQNIDKNNEIIQKI